MTKHIAVDRLSATANFTDVLYGRRSVRAYKPQTVDESLIWTLLDAAVRGRRVASWTPIVGLPPRI
jgi:hypothetical protein